MTSKLTKNKISSRHKKVYVGDADTITPGLQAGLFAKKDLLKGEVVFVGKGEMVFIDVRTKKESASFPNAIGIKKKTWMEPRRNNPLKFLNHSCGANLGIKGRVTFVALGNIAKDEHLTLDYSITENDPLWTLGTRCKCGSTECRKIIRSIQTLPVNIYKKYLPYIPQMFRRSYMEAHPNLKL